MTRSKKTTLAAAVLAGSPVACNDKNPAGPTLTPDWNPTVSRAAAR